MIGSYRLLWLYQIWFISLLTFSSSLDLQPDNRASILQTAQTIALATEKRFNVTDDGSFYNSHPLEEYYWWELGAFYGALIDYTVYTGDKEFLQKTVQKIQLQAGRFNDFMPINETKTEGNEDQAYWAILAMSAAENGVSTFNAESSWLSLAQAVFDDQSIRWDKSTCGGGLRWQIFSFNAGYDFKNSASNGLFFQLAARLARFTKNETYASWADTAYDWSASSGLLTPAYAVHEGIVTSNCSFGPQQQWSANLGHYLYGAAVMYNHTRQQRWRDRVDGFLGHVSYFLGNSSLNYLGNSTNVLIETDCELATRCDIDQLAYKGILAQALGKTAAMLPAFKSKITGILVASAQAAAGNCGDGSECEMKWFSNYEEHRYGPGQQLSALQVVQALVAVDGSAIPTTATGASSTANTTKAGTSNSTTIKTSSSAVHKFSAGVDYAVLAILASIIGLVFAI